MPERRKRVPDPKPGDRFGKLTVISEEGRTKNGTKTYLCHCDCGNDTVVNKYCLTRGYTGSCGCMQGAGASRRALPKPASGTRFGRLTVICEAEPKPRIIRQKRKDGSIRLYEYKEPMILCRCDCGNLKEVSPAYLRNGSVKSCGCLDREHRESLIKHGAIINGKIPRLYRIWSGMRQRCLKSYSPEWKLYGGRGITVCDEWKDSFEAFRDWAMSHGYSDDLSIDRIDNDGNYCPENCRWATVREQALNRRNNVMITVDGQCRSASEWASITGISQTSIMRRILEGWPAELACTTPPIRKRTSITAGGITDTLYGWARRLDTSRDTIEHHAARMGMSLDEAVSDFLQHGVDRRRGRRITINGVTLTVSEWARRTGNSEGMIRQRMFYGWPDDKAILTPSGRKR